MKYTEILIEPMKAAYLQKSIIAGAWEKNGFLQKLFY